VQTWQEHLVIKLLPKPWGLNKQIVNLEIVARDAIAIICENLIHRV
jgi:hypothetical protein